MHTLRWTKIRATDTKSHVPKLGSLFRTSRNTHDLMRHHPEYEWSGSPLVAR